MPPTTVPPQTANGIVTSFLPLTTTFTPDAGCPSAFVLAEQTGLKLAAYDPRYGLSVSSSVQCQPSAAIESFLAPQSINSQGNALVQTSIMPMTCPQSWSTVVSSIKDLTSTLAMCCPPGYSLANGTPGSVIGSCTSNVTSGATLTYASPPGSNGKSWVVTDLVVKAPSSIQVSPLIGWNTGPPATSTPSSASAASTSAQFAGTTSPAYTGVASTGLSTGAKAGIGSGAAIIAIALIAFLVRFAVRRRKVARPTSPVPLPPDPIKDEPYIPSPTVEIEGRNRGHELQAQSTGHELEADRGGEMDGEPRLPGYSLPAELP